MFRKIAILLLTYLLTANYTYAESGVFDIISETGEGKLTNKAVLLAINKVTTKHERLELHIGERIFFGNIAITAHKCNKLLNPYKPDNQIFISVFEHSINSDPEEVFKGWIMSSSPSLSTIEHPIYQIIAVECLHEDEQSS